MSYSFDFPDMVSTGSTVVPATIYASGALGGQAQPTMLVNWLARHAPTTAEQRAYAQERCLAAGTEAIAQAMEIAGLNRAQLAERLGKSRGYVTRVLNGTHNMTLRTLGDMLWACDVEVRDLDVAQLGVIEVSPSDALDWQLGQQVEAETGSLPPVGASAVAAFLAPVAYYQDQQAA